MIEAPIPENEEERLADLYSLELLDTPPEERFERLVRLSSLSFQVPIAYVALVDANRQWFKAQCGLRVSQTGRAESFCGHTIVEGAPLIIPDARADARFRDNPLVVGEPYVRFYGGYPLHGPNGQAVGTLCLVDREPRHLSEEELKLFKELATLVERELHMVDLIRLQRQLIETQGQLAQELGDAEDYMRSLLPAKFAADGVRTDWELVCSSQLGGDFLGYRWLDDNHLAFWVLDVCGHGVGSTLLSISAHDTLRGLRLSGVRHERPEEVLIGLNKAFPMEHHQYKFFTIWYGVYSCEDRTLSYANAGHPPALAFFPGEDEAEQLGEDPGMMVGAMTESTYNVESREMPPGSRVYVFSDGVFEVPGPNGEEQLGLDGFARLITNARNSDDEDKSLVERVYDRVKTDAEDLEDDFTLLEIEFT